MLKGLSGFAAAGGVELGCAATLPELGSNTVDATTSRNSLGMAVYPSLQRRMIRPALNRRQP